MAPFCLKIPIAKVLILPIMCNLLDFQEHGLSGILIDRKSCSNLFFE
jgi:hypothetical protein